jgi:hypothetical protein
MGIAEGRRRRLTVGAAALGLAVSAVVAGVVTGPTALADKPGGHNPPGNNGTFKIDGVPYDDGIDNEPHVTCEFRLVFFGFDKDQRGTIEFRGQAPSGSGRVGGLTNVLLSDDDAGGGLNDRDEIYNFGQDDLDLSRLTAHPKQGYHLKVTVLTGEPGGKKHKVFWLRPCAVTPSPSPTVSPTETGTPSPTVSPTETGTPSPTVSPTETGTPSPTVSPTGTETPSPTGTATPTPTVGGVVTTSPGPTVGGVVTTTPSPEAPQVLGAKQTRGAGELAFGGFATIGLLMLAVALLAAGVLAVVAARRHRATGTG